MKYEIPAVVKAYYDRVGAEILNFSRAMIKEVYPDNAYYTEKTLIRLHPDGKVTCTNPDYGPTPEEAKEIAIALQSCQFPKSILASEAACDRCPAEGQVFRFWNLARTGILMMQARKEGTKHFVPWTYMEDNRWYPMEPDGLLPFWKPKERFVPLFGEKLRIMVHEGAKTAEAAEAIARDPNSRHPWKSFLSKFEHWGMIGGALAPHRSDYKELQMANSKDVVYVCDNDDAGLSVPTKFSKLYGKALKIIRFTDDFKERWDMADAMPGHFFKNGRYQGKSLESYMKPGTWATIHVKPTEENPEEGGDDKKKGKGTYIISDEFAKEWYHSVKPEAYIHKDWPTIIYTETEFNNTVSPFSHVEGTGRVLRKHFGSKSVNIKYNPGKEPGMFAADDGQFYINTFAKCTILPEKGDITPFLDFMSYMIPNNQDKFEVMKWSATLIAKPEIKMTYGILAMSETQGVGKTTLGEHILAPLVGEGNVSYPNEQELVESQFNAWLAHKRLAVVNEIYAGNSSKAYNKLKSVITDHHISVHKKYQDTYEIENFIHVFACSNSKRALKIAMDDRRWFVPQVTEFKQSLAWWERFYNWLNFEGGLNIIRKWADDFIEEHGHVEHGASAPNSAAKTALVKEGYSSGMQIVQRTLQTMRERIENGDLKVDEAFTTDLHLQARIRSELYDGKHNSNIEKPSTIRMVAKEEGWHVSSEKVEGAYWGPNIWGAHLISLKPLDKKPEELGSFKVPASERRKPVDLGQVLDVM